ncbi:MAG: DUF2007 domain-containing protein [Acidobacteria bacterium]|nr:DUF2007 domain-containing protein [Acidobacteriota bacterium]
MAYCPVCKREFEAKTECPDDKVALVDELPYQTVEGDTTTWVEIATVGSEEEARMVRGFLQAEGIPSQYESLEVNMLPVNIGTMGEIRVFVDAEREADAIRLLAEREEDFEAAPSDESVMTDDGPAMIADDAETVSEDDQKS